jgi:AcrR family transcriptional regulator
VRAKDFNDISIVDITEAAEINRSTFYYHEEGIKQILNQ